MKRLFLAGSVLGLTFLLSACSTTELRTISKHLQDRKCETEGSLTVGGPLPPSGWVKWECGKEAN
jgi:hypothetical protein